MNCTSSRNPFSDVTNVLEFSTLLSDNAQAVSPIVNVNSPQSPMLHESYSDILEWFNATAFSELQPGLDLIDYPASPGTPMDHRVYQGLFDAPPNETETGSPVSKKLFDVDDLVREATPVCPDKRQHPSTETMHTTMSYKLPPGTEILIMDWDSVLKSVRKDREATRLPEEFFRDMKRLRNHRYRVRDRTAAEIYEIIKRKKMKRQMYDYELKFRKVMALAGPSSD